MVVSERKLRDKQLRKMASEAFKSMRQIAKQTVEIELSPLYGPENNIITAQCQQALNNANELVLDYIRRSLKYGGIARTPHRPATSKLF